MNAIVKAAAVNDKKERRLSPAGLVASAVLLLFLVVSLCYAVWAWNTLPDVRISGAGWTFLVLGVLATVALGGGLMGLVFYSSRHEMDR